MKYIAIALLALSMGCTSLSKNTRTVIKYSGGGKTFEYTSPKDCTITKAVVDPTTGVLTIEGLSAQVDQAAVSAASAMKIAEAQTTQVLVSQAMTLAIEAAKKSAGVP
jgi:hypothetical protein